MGGDEALVISALLGEIGGVADAAALGRRCIHQCADGVVDLLELPLGLQVQGQERALESQPEQIVGELACCAIAPKQTLVTSASLTAER